MTLEVLPTTTALPKQPQARRHHPPAGAWDGYRECLRWDFGFTCPFCMLHEADLSEHGATGEGMLWVEHFAPRSTHGEQADEYTNCLFSCRFCNNSRLRHPVEDEHGRVLLDPTRTAWAEHFQWDRDALKPKAGDVDAEYTWFAYKLDHDKKRERRRWRRELIETTLSLVDRVPKLIEKLRKEARAAKAGQRWEEARTKIAEAHEWQRNLDTAVKQLQRFRLIPRDAPLRCRCSNTAEMSLPVWLAEQTVTLSLPPIT